MNILLATTEVVPFAKTGGLADVCAALPAELSKLGHRPVIILPAFRQAIECGQPNERLDCKLQIAIGSKTVHGQLLRSRLPGTDIPVYLVEQDDYYDRPGLYQDGEEDYKDNSERFIFFCRAVIEAIRLLDLDVDILHCNDWQTGLIPAYLSIECRSTPGYETTASLFTIHNMAYQGRFWHWDMLLTGLDWKFFNWHQMEFWGDLNLLKTGLVFADAINTVSPGYAREIQSSPLGCGLEGMLSTRRDVLTGILNGADYSVWNPETDDRIARRYGPESWQDGKWACKQALGEELGLSVAKDVPLVGLVSRLSDQKGLDLVTALIHQWVKSENVQWVILGQGEVEYHEMFHQIAQQYPSKVAVRLDFDDDLAHRIEAGADMFLLPSRFEPCGLSQLYSLRYGAVPVVRHTGGLADTITDASDEHFADGTANGFSFKPYTGSALEEALQRARIAFARPEMWAQLVTTGMRQNWSWARSAGQYVQLYESTLARVKQAVHV